MRKKEGEREKESAETVVRDSHTSYMQLSCFVISKQRVVLRGIESREFQSQVAGDKLLLPPRCIHLKQTSSFILSFISRDSPLTRLAHVKSRFPLFVRNSRQFLTCNIFADARTARRSSPPLLADRNTNVSYLIRKLSSASRLTDITPLVL